MFPDIASNSGLEEPGRERPAKPSSGRPTSNSVVHGSPATLAFRLVGTTGGRSGFELTAGDHTLGRSPENDLVLDVPGISRRHARILVDGDGVLVEDLDSKNGTFIEGERVRSSRVPAGGRIRFGSADFRLEPVHPDDLVVGLFTAGEEPPARRGGEPSTSLLEDRPAAGQASIETLEVIARRMLSRDPGGLAAALETLAEALGADGGCVCRWDGAGAPWMLAVAGPVPAEWIVSEAARMLRSGSTAEPGQVRVDAVSGDDGRWMGLASSSDASGARLGVGLFRRSGLDDAEWPLVASFLRLVRARLGVDDRPPALEEPAPRLELPEGFVAGRSPAMRRLFDEMARLAGSDIPVLLAGETGSGKEYLAEILHASGRRRGKLVAINCAAIPAELLEAELFGIGAGVATGVTEREGRFAEADGGTLFLDEIGDMAPTLQAKLLRALEEGRIRPLGKRPRKVDVRIVAATNADLRQRAREGSFREDLFYRIAGCELSVPPLRERPLDVPALVEHYLRDEAEAQGKRILGLSVRALELLCRYRWPGNVRELRNEVRRLVHLSHSGRPIESSLLSEHVRLDHEGAGAPEVHGAEDLELAPRVERLEKSLIVEALRRTEGNVSGSARLLGLSRNGLKLKLRRYEIPADLWKD